jgi:type IV pilus assembly protein PilQ
MMRHVKRFTLWALLAILCPTVALGQPQNEIQEIKVQESGDKTQILLKAKQPLVYTKFHLSEPERLIIDLAGTTLGQYQQPIDVNQGAVVQIQPQDGEEPSYVARLVITLTEAVGSQVRTEGETLVIDLEKPVGAAASEAVAPPVAPMEAPKIEEAPVVEAPPPPTGPSAATVVSAIKVEKTEKGSRVLIQTDGEITPTVFMLDGSRLVVDLPDTTSQVRPATMPVSNRVLKQIRVGQHTRPKKVRVVLDLTKPVTYRSEAQAGMVVVSLEEAEKPASAERPAAAEAPPPPKKEEPMVKKEAAPPSREVSIAPGRKFTGTRISLDFQDAELVNVIRLIADVSGLNIVLGDDVKGKVTIKLINVHWDQALDLILKMHNLGQIRDGNIIRVATLTKIAAQQEEEAKAKENQLKAEDLQTSVVYINYSNATDLVETLKKSLSPRGEITVDKSTNSLVIRDTDKNVVGVNDLIRALDRRTPQVQIEARIVQADTSFARSLGIQWGVAAQSVAGNNIFGIQGTGTSPGQAFNTFAPNFAVNLPASVSGLTNVPSVGLSFGRFTDSPINLDLRLSAGELSGLTKTISNPRIITLDNREAKIEQGESIPFQTTSQQGTQTTFVDATLTLQVTPHITADGNISMKIKATNNQLGTFSGPAGPSIAKREASTEVLVTDGETMVIGGVFVDKRANISSAIPLLSRIPLIGWLFKNDNKTETQNELLIFLTPKIVKT